MKKSIIFLLLLCAVGAGHAWAFDVVNSDGDTLYYYSLTDSTVKVTGCGQTATRVTVPATVTYNGVTYTVVRVGQGAFSYKSRLRYLRLPATIEHIEYLGIEMSRFDSIRIDAAEPPTLARPLSCDATGLQLMGQHPIFVPCGSVAKYRKRWYLDQVNCTYTGLQSDCVVWLQVNKQAVTGIERIVGTGYYEVGDTALLTPWYNELKHSFFTSYLAGWSDGSRDFPRRYVVTATDTLTGIFAPMSCDTLCGNNVSTPVTAVGTLSNLGDAANYFVPADSSSSTIYASAIWVSGRATGEDTASVAAVRFMSDGMDFWPGPLRVGTATTDMETMLQYSKVWLVSRQDIDDFIAHVGSAGYVIPDNILSWPGNGDTAQGYAAQLAPYYDADGNGRYNPAGGDYPLIRGDKAAYAIFNDAYRPHTESGGKVMGLEIHAMAYAFSEPGSPALNNTLFMNYKIYNRSNATYHDAYLGAWTDMDLGSPKDDYIGCDVKRGMYYAYNGKETDGPVSSRYSGVPPAQSCAILAGPYLDADGQDNPKVDIAKMRLYYPSQLENYRMGNGYDTLALTADADLYYPTAWHFAAGDTVGNCAINGIHFGNNIMDDERMGMRRFVYYNNSTTGANSEPSVASDYNNYLRGRWKTGARMRFGGNALSGSNVEDIPCDFMFPGDSDPLHWGTDGIVPMEHFNDWTEKVLGNGYGDRRGLASSGPFTFAPQSMQPLDLAFTTAWGEDSVWASVEALRLATDTVRGAFLRDTTPSGKAFEYRPYSAPLEIARAAEDVRLQLFPNPTTGQVSVRMEGNDRPQTVELLDMLGRRLQTHRATHSLQIDLSAYPRGIYLLRCQGTVKRIVKE